MNEDFENNNFENKSDGQIPGQQEPQQTPNVNTQTNQNQTQPPYAQPQFTNPVQNPQNGYYQNNPNNNYYNPYQYAPVPPAPRKQPKNKKKGVKIAALIVVIALLITIFAGVGKMITKGSSNTDKKTEESSDKTVTADDSELILESSDDEDSITAKSVYNKIKNTNVGILTYASNSVTLSGEGSGIIMGENSDNTATYIITCAHVISASNISIKVQLLDGTQYDAKVVGMDVKTDIGLLSISATGLTAATFADSDEVEVGDTVYAIGNPGGTEFFGSFTDGMISAIGRPVDSPVGYEVLTIQHTAAVNPGNSGGALLNSSGQVIGMNSSKIASTEYEDMAFAVPSATIKEVVDELIKNGYVTGRPILGITYYPVSYSQAHSLIVQAYNLPAGTIIIDGIYKSSDLIDKDVKSGDMIIAYNGNDLDDYNDLLDYINSSKVGSTITLTICRVDSNQRIQKFDVEVTLVEDTGDNTLVEEEEATEYYNPIEEFFRNYGRNSDGN